MSKYIIDIPKTVGMGTLGSVHYTYFDGIQCQTIVLKSDEIEELNSDYINEHFSDIQDTAYQRGLEDAWNVARKIAVETDDGGVSISALYEMFGTESMCMIMKNNTVYDVTDKLKAYEEKQKTDDEIKVGDEVYCKGDDTSDSGVVTWVGKKSIYAMWQDGSAGEVQKDEFIKTGRHFDISSILKEMQS